MVLQGARGAQLPSSVAEFACNQYGRKVKRGEQVVGFRNWNKPQRGGWDHVCAGKCADTYEVLPYVPVAQRATAATSTPQSNSTGFGSTIIGALGRLTGSTSTVNDADQSALSALIAKCKPLGYSDLYVGQVLAQQGGDVEAGFRAIVSTWAAEVEPDLQADNAANQPVDPTACDECSECSGDDIVPSASSLVEPQVMSSNMFRSAGWDVISTFVLPLLPKPQTDGSFKDGDPELLDALMTTPATLALPRPEQLADLIKPKDGWTDTLLQRARSFFALAGVGVQFLLFLPTITHRRQLARSELFRVQQEGVTTGVRDCCPHCECNSFVNTTHL